MPLTPTFYESPPGSGGNDGALPAAWIAGWWLFTNLTGPQIVAFQSFPTDLMRYANLQRNSAEYSGITVAGGTIPITTSPDDLSNMARIMQWFREGVVTSVPYQDGNGNWHTVSQNQAISVYQAVMSFIAQIRVTTKTLVDGINATPPTITTRKQIDQAIGAIAPNSASALHPSPT